MKIESLKIKNYKQFTNLELKLTYPMGHKKEGQPLDKICIIGQSGTGKTNLLKIIRDKKNNNDLKTVFRKEESSNSEKIYFVSVEKYSQEVLSQTNIEFSSYDKQLLEKLEYAKGKLVLEEIDESHNEHILPFSAQAQIQKIVRMQDSIKTVQDKRREVNWEINRIKDKYSFDSKENISTNKNIINININDNVFELLKEKTKNYDTEKSKYTRKLSNKLVHTEYSKEDFILDIKKWEEENENILEKIANDINHIISNFNLELEIDEDTNSYEELIIKDFSTDKIINYDDVSTGTKNLVSTLMPLRIHKPKDSIILIDEPENSFYPNIQRQLTDLYMNIGENNQLIMATHSPLIASSFEPWEVVELKFDKNTNQIYREKYYEGDEDHVDNYFLNPQLLTWTSILTRIFDLNEDSNFNVREKELRKYASLDMELRKITNKKEKMEKFEELMKLSELLGLSDNEEN